MKKLLIIDKDQTLVRSRLGGESFIQKPWDQVPIEGMAYKLNKLFFQYEWRIVIASNQGGVETGKKSLESAILEMEYCLELFPVIDFALFCPDYAGLSCYRVCNALPDQPRDFNYVRIDGDSSEEIACFAGQFRKPNPGMLQLARYEYEPDQCLYVGDRPEDEQAAIAANIPYLHRDKFLEMDTASL